MKDTEVWTAVIHNIYEVTKGGNTNLAFSTANVKPPGASTRQTIRVLRTLEKLKLVVHMPHGYHHRHWRIHSSWPELARIVIDRFMVHGIMEAKFRPRRG